MKKTLLQALAIAAVLSPAVALTQSGKTKPTTATYITKEEVDIVNQKGQGIDRNIKVVDIGHENFTVGIIHRGKTVNGAAVPAAGANAAPAAAIMTSFFTGFFTAMATSASSRNRELWVLWPSPKALP